MPASPAKIEEKGFPIVESSKIIFQCETVVLIEIETLRYYVSIRDVQDHGENTICFKVVSFENGVLEERYGDEQTSWLYLSGYNCPEWYVHSIMSDKTTIYLTLVNKSLDDQD